jgi:hypothetical protein
MFTPNRDSSGESRLESSTPSPLVSLQMTILVAAVSDYFRTVRPELDKAYDWEIPKKCPFDFERGSDSCAQANRRLRRVLSKIWQNDPRRRLEIAVWYVRDWGGIKSNGKGTIENYVSVAAADLAAGPMQGVATWSKILAVRNPNAYAIFDARVSAALTAIQLNHGVNDTTPFPSLPSKNTKIKKFQAWLASQPLAKQRPKPTYNDYILLLKAVAEQSRLSAPEEVEMALFANAEKLVSRFVGPVGDSTA